jgi:hypothetical protein
MSGIYDAVQNPIPKSNLWVTPENFDQLYEMLNQYTGEQASLAMHVAMLTMNTCNKAVEDKILSKEIFCS